MTLHPRRAFVSVYFKKTQSLFICHFPSLPHEKNFADSCNADAGWHFTSIYDNDELMSGPNEITLE
jgi:hypothetical protein